MPSQIILSLLSLLANSVFFKAYANSNQLSSSVRVGCTCPGDTLTFTCTVMDTGITVWSGTAISSHCNNNEIPFLHLLTGFEEQPSKNCSNGALVAQTQSVENNVTFTSTLTVLVSERFYDQTVECSHDRGQTHGKTVVGNFTITVVSAILTALRVNVSEVTKRQLSLGWDSMAPICPSTVIRYAILTDNKSNCGNCTLSPSGQTSATCSITPSATSVLCTFTVQSFVCNDSNPTTEDSVNVTLKVPDTPKVAFIPTYSVKSRRLLSISFTIIKEDTFVISGDMKATILYYNISFSESGSSSLCSSSLYPASELSCVEDNVCSVNDIDLVSSQCSLSAPLNFAVFAINQLGNGLETPITTLGHVNDFISVTYNPSTFTLTCMFLSMKDESERSCSIRYGSNPQQLTSMTRNINTSTIITLVLHSIDQNIIDYHYVITATNGSYTVKVKGTLNSTKQTSVADPLNNTFAIVGSVVGIMFIIIISAIVTVTLVVSVIRLKLCKQCSRYKQANLTLENQHDSTALSPSTIPLETIPKQENITESPGSCKKLHPLTDKLLGTQKPSEAIQIESSVECVSSTLSCSEVKSYTVDGATVTRNVEVSNEVAITTAKLGTAKQESMVEVKATETSAEHSLISGMTVECNGTTFKVFHVKQECELDEFISADCQLSFERGRAYYEFTHNQENITDKQKVLLFNKETGEFLTGHEALKMIKAPDVTVQRPLNECFEKYKVFVQSIGSGARHLDAKSIVLYKECSDAVIHQELAQESLIAVHPDIYEMYPLEFDCTFESFCLFKKLKSTKNRVYVELSRIIDCGDIQDAVVIDKASGRYFTGCGAKEISLELKRLMKNQRSSLPNPSSLDSSGYEENFKMTELTQKWLVLVSCKFSKNMHLSKDTHVLYLSNTSTSQTLENVHELKVDKDCIQLSKFIEENLSKTFEGDKVFYEFTREKEDIHGDTEVILMHKETNVFTRLLGSALSSKIAGAPGLGVKRPTLENHKIFIQSKSHGSRCLRIGTSVLYKVIEDREKIKVEHAIF